MIGMTYITGDWHCLRLFTFAFQIALAAKLSVLSCDVFLTLSSQFQLNIYYFITDSGHLCLQYSLLSRTVSQPSATAPASISAHFNQGRDGHRDMGPHFLTQPTKLCVRIRPNSALCFTNLLHSGLSPNFATNYRSTHVL